MATGRRHSRADEQRLAELGYKQELKRGWSGFSNFAISFSIISILAGLLHDLRAGVEQRRPGRDLDRLAGDQPVHPAASPSRCPSWPPRCRPPAGSTTGPRSSAAPAWGWFTGWFNLIGLVAVVASVDYAAATFLNATSAFYNINFLVNFATTSVPSSLHHTFVLFVIILASTR